MRHFFAVLVVTVTACGDSTGPGEVLPAELVGDWEAVQACLPNCGFTLVRVDNPADSVNFVSALGATFLLDIRRSGRFDISSPTGGVTIEGTARVEEDLLIVRDGAGVEDTADYSVAGGFLSLGFRGVTEQFDFDGDQIGDPSTIRAVFRRR